MKNIQIYKAEKYSSDTCYLEFSGAGIEDIEKLLQIVGKHVYNRAEERDGKTYIKLVIE